MGNREHWRIRPQAGSYGGFVGARLAREWDAVDRLRIRPQAGSYGAFVGARLAREWDAPASDERVS
jgi:hypothetical protein